jgi:hypothetical protein
MASLPGGQRAAVGTMDVDCKNFVGFSLIFCFTKSPKEKIDKWINLYPSKLFL